MFMASSFCLLFLVLKKKKWQPLDIYGTIFQSFFVECKSCGENAEGNTLFKILRNWLRINRRIRNWRTYVFFFFFLSIFFVFSCSLFFLPALLFTCSSFYLLLLRNWLRINRRIRNRRTFFFLYFFFFALSIFLFSLLLFTLLFIYSSLNAQIQN